MGKRMEVTELVRGMCQSALRTFWYRWPMVWCEMYVRMSAMKPSMVGEMSGGSEVLG